MSKVTPTRCIALLLVVGALVIGVASLVRDSAPESAPVAFSDGTALRLLAVTAGTNHVHGPALARLLLALPKAITDPLLRRLPGSMQLSRKSTIRPALVLWVECTPPPGASSGGKEALLRGRGVPASGVRQHLTFATFPGTTPSISAIEFPAWPRRDALLECVCYERGSDYNKRTEVGVLRFRNPSLSAVQGWLPAALPATNRAGDVEVTLLEFASGIGQVTHKARQGGRPVKSLSTAVAGEEPRALVRCAFNSPRGTNESWVIFDATLDDAAGNSVSATSRSGMTSTMEFDPILWPDEPAWRAKLHLKRDAGFSPEELLTFTRVAIPEVGTTNQLNLTNHALGVQTVLKWFVRRPDLGDRQSWSSDDLSALRIEHPDLGPSNQLDLIRITLQPAGTNLTTSGSSWSTDYHEFSLRSVPANGTHLDLTFAVQPTRFVEFLVPPNWITNTIELLEK